MAELIAQKNRASQALNGDVSSDGLNAMLGEEGDLQTMLIKSIKKGQTIKGSSEEWISQTSDRARELLQNIGKKKKIPTLLEQYKAWTVQHVQKEATLNVLHEKAEWVVGQIHQGRLAGFNIFNNILSVDLIHAFGFDYVDDQMLLDHIFVQTKPIEESLMVVSKKKHKKNSPIDGQLGFELFG